MSDVILIKDAKERTTGLIFDGQEYFISRPARASIFDWLAANKKAITGSLASLSLGVFAVIQSVPELATTYPVAVKLTLAILAAIGFAVAHSSQPDAAAAVPPPNSQAATSPITAGAK